MIEKKLVMNDLTAESRSYIDCLYSLLTTAGLYHMPKFMLSGMTGMLFKFVIHKRLLPSSLDMYNWQWENWNAVNLLGIYNEIYVGSPMNAAFRLYQKQMLVKIKKSIDEGIAVIGWGHERPQFCLYTGYNEEDGVLFYRDSASSEDEVLLYDNLGLIDEGDWHVQIIGNRMDKDIRDIFRESLESAVIDWHTEYKVRPEYGAGKRAYENLLNALKSGDFNYKGAYYVLKFYLNAKIEISRYMDAVIKEIPELAVAAGLFRKLSDTLAPIKAVKLAGVPEADIKYIPMAADIFGKALQLEENAVKELERYLQNYIHNKGTNPARLKDLY